MGIMGEYKIICYHDDFLHTTMDTIEYLSGNQYESNEAYLKWKYYDNPYTKHPLGIIALYNDKVVGFRGYMATKWQVKDLVVDILCAGDTVVHPDHRKKGLSIAMGEKANDEYKSYMAFLNFSGGQTSIPGYSKLGFVPLVDKRYMFMDQQSIDGQFDNIECFYDLETMPESVYGNKISIKKDNVFFNWRFKNNRVKYKFYYHKQNGVVTDYIVTSIDENITNAIIVDYSENDIDVVENILRYIINENYNSFVSIKSYSLTDNFSNIVDKLGFQFRERSVLFPILIRATQDWFINGLDIRDYDNWELRGICSDNT